ncbi:MAG: hypothetical protein ACF8MJ_09500, partial [Phycisphaerales bacterium JB050]
LKRDQRGGHMDLQALRYAAMVAPMTWSRLVDTHAEYLSRNGADPRDAERQLLDFLDWNEPDEAEFPSDVRIVLVSGGFSQELTTAVLWLNQRGIDIRCVQLQPYERDGELLIWSEQCLPLPAAEDYQVRLREKSARIRASKAVRGEATGYHFINTGEDKNSNRSWDHCVQYGFISAGGGARYVNAVKKFQAGDRVFAYASRHGYVGICEVIDPAVPRHDFVPAGENRNMSEILSAELGKDVLNRDRNLASDMVEHCARVRWLAHVPKDRAISDTHYRQTTCRIRNPDLVERLLSAFGVEESRFSTQRD